MYEQTITPPLQLAAESRTETFRLGQKRQAQVSDSSLNGRVSLLQLLSQYNSVRGWIVLIAPEQLPDKAIAKHYQLELNNVLVIHAKQISDLNETLLRALTSTTCKVVINFANTCPSKLDSYRLRAQANNIHFYHAEQLLTVVRPH